MPGGNVPQGQRFSLVYLRRDEQLEDSDRMRRRLGAAIFNHLTEDKRWAGFQHYFLSETGLPYKQVHAYQGGVSEYFASLGLRDALDSISIFVSYCRMLQAEAMKRREIYARHDEVIKPFVAECRRILSEEGVRYSVDDRGGVHLKVDEQFEVTRAAAVRLMGSPRYAAALSSLEAGYRALDGVPPDGREAIRDVFGAAENIFKQMFGAPRLAGFLIDQHFKPAIAALPWNQEALEAGAVMNDGLKAWVTAAHKYRH